MFTFNFVLTNSRGNFPRFIIDFKLTDVRRQPFGGISVTLRRYVNNLAEIRQAEKDFLFFEDNV